MKKGRSEPSSSSDSGSPLLHSATLASFDVFSLLTQRGLWRRPKNLENSLIQAAQIQELLVGHGSRRRKRNFGSQLGCNKAIQSCICSESLCNQLLCKLLTQKQFSKDRIPVQDYQTPNTEIEDRSSTADRAPPQRPFRSRGNTTAVMLRNLCQTVWICQQLLLQHVVIICNMLSDDSK